MKFLTGTVSNGMKKFYITTTLPYVNADPHIGFALEIVQADVIARYFALKKYEVFFNTGTDEHGLKVFQGAQKEKIDPKKYCDIYAEKNKKLKLSLNLSYNNFIRTTDDFHIKAAQEFWILCQKNGDIYKKKYKIKYCVGCELEKTESELINGRCPLHPDQEIQIIEEENYFFRYSKYQKPLLDFYKKNKNFVIPEQRFNEIKEFTKRGLEDFSISRLKEKMSWGVPVPNDEKHIMYVWFDALVNYISVLGWPKNSKKFKDFWPGMQVAGKDNLRQQSSMWQAMLLSASLPNSKQIFIHGFITSNGQKMSKSSGNVVNPFELVEKYGIDVVRYFLLAEFPPAEDGDFTIKRFEERYNSDLASGIGNLVARVVAMAEKKTKNQKLKTKNTIQNLKLKKEIKNTQKKYKEALDNFKFNEALKSIWELISFCDKYINEEKPWEEKDEKAKIKNQKVINDLLFVLGEIADLLLPFLPQTAEKIKKQIEIDKKTGELKNKKSPLLFPRLT